MSLKEGKTVHSALVILLPPCLAPAVQKFRVQHDKSYASWPPHINLLYPFLPATDFGHAVTVLNEALVGIEPFLLKLDTVSHFQHRHSATIFLKASDASLVKKVQAAVDRLFPHCNDLSQRGEADGEGFIPHLTLGQTKKVVELEKIACQECLTQDIEWMVDGLYLISRKRDDSFEIRNWIPFKGVVSENSKLLGTKYIAETYGGDTDIVERGVWSVQTPESYQRQSKFLMWYERPTYVNSATGIWIPSRITNNMPLYSPPPTHLIIVTYNILFDSLIYPSKRYHLLSAHLSHTNADLIALQEVTPTFLRFFLAQGWVRENGYTVSHSLNDARNFSEKGAIVLLSRYPFRHYHLSFSAEKHLLVARVILGSQSRPLYVPVVHLTSNHYTNTNTRIKRAEQMSWVYAFLNALSSSEWDGILVGDFNTDDEREVGLISHGFRDAWEFLQSEEKQRIGTNEIYADKNGYTFDPTTNTLAELVARNKDLPRRLDRVAIRGCWVPEKISRIGVDPLVEEEGKCYLASDHYGLCCRLLYDVTTLSKSEMDTNTSIKDDVYFESSEEILNLLRSHNVFETPEGDALRSRALDLLSTSLKRTINHVLITLGSYALGVHSPSSDIDCLCISSITQERFLSVIQNVFSAIENRETSICIRRIVADALIPVVKLRVLDSVDIDLQYCCAPPVVERWEELATLPLDASFPNLRASTMAILNGWRDTTVVLRSVPDLGKFRLVYRTIKLWCECKGLYSSRFGYVGGAALTVLVVRVCQAYPNAGPGELVHRFFEQYGNYPWESRPVTLSTSSEQGGGILYRRSDRDAMCILTAHRPQVNITRNATKHNRRVWAEELRNAMDLLMIDGTSLESLFSQTDFLSRYKSYVQITLYASNRSGYRELVAHFESRCVELLTKMQQRNPDLLAHAFPKRFKWGTNDSSQGYTGRYLIGLSRASATAEPAKEKRERQLSEFLEVLREFEDGLRAWKGIKASMWCEVKHVAKSKLDVSELDEQSDAQNDIEIVEGENSPLPKE
ncbi:Poly(A) polymerase central domain-containing protein [Endogone sp. FLAS-F59071]|nr:Poly(A) polymerase central domain-containing protein [Endogone sp. FLAS-F59071]|eukprot:RUS18557.1 Poly(A) polymerase central domain-containing protein [Endogone sp. FLAS-F59071]